MGVGGVGLSGFLFVWGDGQNARVKRCVKEWICQGGGTQIRPLGLPPWKFVLRVAEGRAGVPKAGRPDLLCITWKSLWRW